MFMGHSFSLSFYSQLVEKEIIEVLVFHSELHKNCFKWNPWGTVPAEGWLWRGKHIMSKQLLHQADQNVPKRLSIPWYECFHSSYLLTLFSHICFPFIDTSVSDSVCMISRLSVHDFHWQRNRMHKRWSWTY